MKTTSYDGGGERQALIDCVASWEVAEYAVRTFPEAPSIAGSNHAKTIFNWLFAFHPNSDGLSYADAGLSRDWNTKGPELPKDTKEGVESLLKAVGDDWRARAPKAIPQAKEDVAAYFRVATARTYAERLLKSAEAGDFKSFENSLGTYKVTGRTEQNPTSIFEDAERVYDALTATDSVLFRFPGALGELLGPIIRGDFLAPLAREKMGKSWIVDYVAKTAAMQGCHVLLVDAEMVPDQKLRRIWRQIIGCPVVDGEYELPYFDADGEIMFRAKHFKGMTMNLADVQKYMNMFRRISGGGCIDVQSVPTGGTMLRDVEALIQDHIRDHGKPYDLVIVDSLDYLEAENRGAEGLEKLFEIWRGFRGLGQKYDCALCSPSHLGRAKVKGAASEDSVYGSIQKLWVVTKTMMIDATKDEQENGVLRVTTRTTRDNKSRKDTVVVLQGLDIARPVLDSRWLSDVHSDLVYRPQSKFESRE
jgi:hypothetical protein